MPGRAQWSEPLSVLDAEELRIFVRALHDRLDGDGRRVLLDALRDHAARSRSGWRPAAPEHARVEADLQAVAAAVEDGCEDPERVDGWLSHADDAFLAGDFASARSLYFAVLHALANGAVDVGADEVPSEVLSSDLSRCELRCAVAAYRSAAPAERALKVLEVVRELLVVAPPGHLLHDLEEAAGAPLPDLDAFLPGWIDLLRTETSGGKSPPQFDRWLAEATLRRDGVAGLGRLALSTGNTGTLRDWCRQVQDAGDWAAALDANERAAKALGRSAEAAFFLDGAALAARELGRSDFVQRIDDAFRAGPTLARLTRLLAAGSPGASELRRRAAGTLARGDALSDRLRGLLSLVAGNVEAAARLLEAAPGLGWSRPDHPGAILFPALARIAADAPPGTLRAELFAPLCRSPGFADGGDFGSGTAAFDVGDDDGFGDDDVCDVCGEPHEADDPFDPDEEIDADLDGDDDDDEGDDAADESDEGVAGEEVAGTAAWPPARPRLDTPAPASILDAAGLHAGLAAHARAAILKALRTCAEARAKGVLDQKRRSRYDHAALLVAAFVEVVGSIGAERGAREWAEGIEREYRRFPAFRKELAAALARVRPGTPRAP